jgi:predicted nucleic acid-binding protein
VAALIDTNVLVYAYDPRFPAKQRVAGETLRLGIAEDSVRVPHQAIIEFVAATTRSIRGGPSILRPAEARRVAEEMLDEFEVLMPNQAIVRTAIRGAAAYDLPWFDAHLWAYAEHYALETILSEDFEHGRRYGTVTIMNPFLAQP